MKLFKLFLVALVATPTFALAQTSYSTSTDTDPVFENRCTLSKFMAFGYRDIGTAGQVSRLQNFLIEKGYLTGKTTGYYGTATRSAVQSFQLAHGVLPSSTSKGYGNVGLLTRTQINKLMCQTIPTSTSALTPDQIKVTYPSDTTISVGEKVTITYTVGSNIVARDPAIIERLIVDPNTDAMRSGYVPVSNSAGEYTFDWTPHQSGTYQALLKINLNNTQYTARSGVITVVSSPPPTPDGSATIDTSSLTSSSGMPTISGYAYNVTQPFGVSISGSGGKIWGSGNISVNNNRWSTRVGENLSPGTYQVQVYSNNILAANGTLTITSSAPTTQ